MGRAHNLPNKFYFLKKSASAIMIALILLTDVYVELYKGTLRPLPQFPPPRPQAVGQGVVGGALQHF